MIENIESLAALSDYGTMSRAAVKIGITQSAISKRIHALEDELGRSLVEKHGRNVVLTPFACELLETSRPLLVNIKNLLEEIKFEDRGRITVATAHGLLVSWAAPALANVRETVPGIELEVSAELGSIAVDKVRSGEVMLALVSGLGEQGSDLVANKIADERMVIIPSGLKPFDLQKERKVKVIGLPRNKEVWQILARRMKRNAKRWNFCIESEQTIVSYAGIVQFARHGFGHGIAPREVTRALGLSAKQVINFPDPGLYLPCCVVGRRSTFARPVVKTFMHALRAGIPRTCALKPTEQ